MRNPIRVYAKMNVATFFYDKQGKTTNKVLKYEFKERLKKNNAAFENFSYQNTYNNLPLSTNQCHFSKLLV